jgi:hypothetical protein
VGDMRKLSALTVQVICIFLDGGSRLVHLRHTHPVLRLGKLCGPTQLDISELSNRSKRIMSFGRPPTFAPFSATPPDRGSFPLDHEGRTLHLDGHKTLTRHSLGECKAFMTTYLQCLSKNKNDSTPCRPLNKEYLECRMSRYVNL